MMKKVLKVRSVLFDKGTRYSRLSMFWNVLFTLLYIGMTLVVMTSAAVFGDSIKESLIRLFGVFVLLILPVSIFLILSFISFPFIYHFKLYCIESFYKAEGTEFIIRQAGIISRIIRFMFNFMINLILYTFSTVYLIGYIIFNYKWIKDID